MTAILETDRLNLVRPDAADWPGFRTLFASERSRFVGGPLATMRAWMVFAADVGHWDLRGWGLFGVRAKNDARSVGMVGHFYPEGWPEREIGWLIWDGEEGRGFATEAARAAREHAYDTLGWDGAVSYIHPDNTGSIAVAERLGCTRDAKPRRMTEDDPAVVYRHPSPGGHS